MLKRASKIFVGTDIARTASLIIYGASGNLANGEIFVTDKNKVLLAAGSTVADSNIIFIGAGINETYDYVTETGTAVTDVRRIEFSSPIEAGQIKEYRGTAYSVAVQEVATVSGTFTPVIGEEYILRFVYKELPEHPGQFTHTYRQIATSVTLATLYDAFESQVNAHKSRRVNLVTTDTPDVMTFTARAIPSLGNDSVNAIDEYSLVNFELFLISENFDSAAVAYTSDAFKGEGVWQQVRDAEKSNLQDQFGATNRTAFPVILPTLKVVKSETYDTIVIQSDRSYQSPDNSFINRVPHSTIIYLPDGASQTTNILAVLNPYMASAPGAFANISF